MSYTRQVRKTITVHYSGTVSYPASNTPGTKSYSGTVQEQVIVNVHVDTDPFDASSADCRATVDGLTASVVATESAQVASIKQNARRVGKTLVDGFFKTVRSEISQQINELKNLIDATLLKLQSDAKRCSEMRHQMEVDYNRKCDQYLSIFNKLDNELAQRIHDIDQPAFRFREDADSLNGRLSDTDMVTTATIVGGENACLDARLSVTLNKQRAYDTLGKASRFLQVQKRTDNTVTASVVKSDRHGDILLPVCYTETTVSDGSLERNVYCHSCLDAQKNRVGEALREVVQSTTEEEQAAVRRFFNDELAAMQGDDAHVERVRREIIQLFNH